MMMLTEDTADQMKREQPPRPEQSIRAGSRYFADLREAVAALGQRARSHLDGDRRLQPRHGPPNGARHFAQKLKKNPDSWYMR